MEENEKEEREGEGEKEGVCDGQLVDSCTEASGSPPVAMETSQSPPTANDIDVSMETNTPTTKESSSEGCGVVMNENVREEVTREGEVLNVAAIAGNSNNNSNKRSGDEGESGGEGEGEGTENRRRSLRARKKFDKNSKINSIPAETSDRGPEEREEAASSEKEQEEEEEEEGESDQNDWEPQQSPAKRGRGR